MPMPWARKNAPLPPGFGIINNIFPEQQVIAVPALKNMVDIPERIYTLTGKNNFDNLTVLGDYHFGGYAKKNNELLDFMNNFFSATSVPLDFVYTAKMMYGVFDLLRKGEFPEGSTVVAVHTGGLQGWEGYRERYNLGYLPFFMPPPL